MVTLDFSKCKTVEDVEKVFENKKDELNPLKIFKKKKEKSKRD